MALVVDKGEKEANAVALFYLFVVALLDFFPDGSFGIFGVSFGPVGAALL